MRVDLDHVAVATRRWSDAWPTLAGSLGGRWTGGGLAPGFAPSQLVFANEMRIEVLSPNEPEKNDFLVRYLDRSGPGPHHLTFKVDSLDDAIGAVDAFGIPPYGEDRSDPEWHEIFLHPRDSRAGIVVQIAQTFGPPHTSDPPPGFPAPVQRAASVSWIGHAVASLADAIALFEGLLLGTRVAEGDARGARWVEVAWHGPGRLRLLEPTDHGPLRTWLGARPGRVHHVAFAVDEPAAVTGAVACGEGTWAVPPEASGCGTRLLLTPR